MRVRLREFHFLASLCVLCFITGTSIATKQNDKYMFKIVPAHIELDPPQILVTFPSGLQDEFVLKHHIVGPSNKKRCNYLGHIQNSLSSSVAVTGCMRKPGDQIDITMISPHSGLKMYSVDFFGNAEEIEIPKDAIQVVETRKDKEDDEIIDDKEEEELAATEKIDYIPPVVRAVVKFGYDKGLIEVLEKYNTTFEDWFNGVLTHTQAHFREGRLGTIIELEVAYPHIYRDDVRWNSCDHHGNATDEFAKYDLDEELVAMRNWFVGIQKCGYYGLGTLGMVCRKDSVTLNVGHPGNPTLDSAILAHEMGHNLGQGHCKRTKEDGDWYWASCLIAAFQEHFTLNQLERGCLVDISGGCDPNPCKNGGKCSERTYDGIEKTVMKNAISFKCECPKGTSGARCEYVEGGCYGGDDCCTEERKCGLEEGNCKSDKDCEKGLKCGSGNCYNWWTKDWWKGDNCCFNPDTCSSRSLERFEPKGFYGTCVFPFTKNSTVYNSCAETKKYDGIGWCAWDSEYKEDRWGYCTPSCPNACHHGCQCRAGSIGDKSGGDDIDDEGYCRNWCSPYYYCGHTKAYIDGIDCRGCNSNENDHVVCSGEEKNCCHPFHKCGENEGECKLDTDCQDGMRCADKLCYQSECAKKEGPCKESQGDCDALSDCEEGLVCGSDNCPKGINELTNADFKDDDDCCYQPKGYVPLGCWNEARATPDRAIPEYLGYENRKNAMKGCYLKAWKKGYKVFAVRYGGECWSSKNAIESYNKYGVANDCWGGIGGDYSNAVYQITDFEFNQQSIGEDCWSECGKKQGPCAWCGSQGYCCTQKSGWTDTTNGCDGTFGGVSKHECALKPN